ncbi:hypothetical protein D3C72_1244320 [compost metagenome]
MVGAISRRLRSVSAMPAGVGLPSSMNSVPPLSSTMPTLWLPPKVWFQGSQSTSTGGSSPRAGIDWRSCCWLAHHMRCVLITALGILVEPEVKRNLVMVSGPVACIAASMAGVAGVAASTSKRVVARPSSVPSASTTSVPAGTVAAMALAKRAASAANTRPGVSVSMTWRSLS